MLNTNIKLGSNSQTVQFNSPSTGILQRSHPKSTFIRFQKGSELEKSIFPHNGQKPYLWINGEKKHMVVLQILIFGDNYYLVEIVNEEYLTES